MSKKDIVKHYAALQEMYAECGKKYGIDPHQCYLAVMADSCVRKSEIHHSKEQTFGSG